LKARGERDGLWLPPEEYFWFWSSKNKNASPRSAPDLPISL
jgi:hypothetical protein